MWDINLLQNLLQIAIRFQIIWIDLQRYRKVLNRLIKPTYFY